jgi:hypothetical protein
VQDIYLRQVAEEQGKQRSNQGPGRSGPWLQHVMSVSRHRRSLYGSRPRWISADPSSFECLNVAAVRPAALPGRLGSDADLRDHGRHQPGRTAAST